MCVQTDATRDERLLVRSSVAWSAAPWNRLWGDSRALRGLNSDSGSLSPLKVLTEP